MKSKATDFSRPRLFYIFFQGGFVTYSFRFSIHAGKICRAGWYCFVVFMTHGYITCNLLTPARDKCLKRHAPYTVALTIPAACPAGIAFIT